MLSSSHTADEDAQLVQNNARPGVLPCWPQRLAAVRQMADYSGLLRQTVCEDAWRVQIVGRSGVCYLSMTTSAHRQIAHTGVMLVERLVL